MRSLTDSRGMITKKTNKFSCVVVLNLYLKQGNNLAVKSYLKTVVLVIKFYRIWQKRKFFFFESLKSQGKVTVKELKYFTYEYKKSTTYLSKMYLFLKTRKTLSNVHSRLIISNCWRTKEKGKSQNFQIIAKAGCWRLNMKK